MSFRQVLQRGQEFLHIYPRGNACWDVMSGATLATVGFAAKSFLNLKHSYELQNGDYLLEAIKQSKLEKRGLVTVMNHISVLDDPLVWGTLPMSYLMRPTYTRWTLGADNICFTNRAKALFFSLGQVLSTKRFGAGPFQPALDASVYLLSRTGHHQEPQWLHIFPEGFVHQPLEPYETTMKYFKWGLSRAILEPTVAPIVVPMYAHGLETVFPEDSPKALLGYPSKTKLIYRIGEPWKEADVLHFRHRWHDLARSHDINGYVPTELQEGAEARQLRSELAGAVRILLLKVRRDIGLADEAHPSLGDPKFWHENVSTHTVRLKGRSLEEKARMSKKQ